MVTVTLSLHWREKSEKGRLLIRSSLIPQGSGDSISISPPDKMNNIILIRSINLRALLFLVTVVLLFTDYSTGAESEIWINPVDSMRFVYVPPGSLTVQTAADQDGAIVIIPEGFRIAACEVTVNQFRKFAEATGHLTDAEKSGHPYSWRTPGFQQSGSHPVVYLSANDALSYARWAGVDLPTETEWLYACRAGTTSRYFWGDAMDNRYVWHRENSSDGTKPVGTRLQNPWGLFDMVGNAWEYVMVCDTVCIPRGGSWTRCPVYQTRTGSFYEGIFHAVEPVLTLCQPVQGITPFDDDRGFRCIRRVSPIKEFQ